MYPQVFGKYILERELARGGMARVLLATLRGADGFEKRLVVKQIRDELAHDDAFVSRFVTEAKTTVALNHPNIVPVYELGVEQGTYYLSMELVEGVSLSELVGAKGGGALSPEEGAYVGAEVCRALDYAHRRMAVVHRDVTPRNVMIDEEGQVRIIDFGIAARASEGLAQAFGTLGHMPPEQMEGLETTPAADIFAVAVLLLEAWSGRPPYRRKTREEVVALLEGPTPKPSAIDIRLLPLDDVIEKALAKRPADRPQQAEDLARVLRRFLGGIDSGDLARRLGDRVRDVRQGLAAAAAERAATKSLPSPSKASFADLGTRTFAAREEVNRWVTARPPPADAPEAGVQEGGTRQLLSDPPVGTRRLNVLTPAIAIGLQRGIPVALPMPPIPTGPALLPTTDGGALLAGEEPSRGQGRGRRSALAVLAAALLAVGVGTASWLTRRATGPLPAQAQVAPPGAEPSAGAAAPVDEKETSLAKAVPPQTSDVVPTPSAAGDPPEPVAAPAHASFFGDPGTRVFLDGASRGPCPLRDVSLPPGAHEVRFVFGPTGETALERVTLRAGQRVTLRAEFTGTTPRVRVERRAD